MRYRPLLAPSIALAGLVSLILAAPILSGHDPIAMDISSRLAPAGAEHLLGQDEFGRDIWSRLLYGGRVSLLVALISAMAAGVLGTALGIVGGYFRGVAEMVTLRLADLVISFPPILLALLVVTLLGPGTGTLIGVLAVLYAPGFARVAYGETLSVASREFVEASRALGTSDRSIMLRTILPNIAGPLVVQFSLTVAAAIVIESGLSFLGLGVVPPEPSWGLMIRGARTFMNQAPTMLFYPCFALVATIFIINQLCDALRDVLDPKGAALASLPALLWPVRGGRHAVVKAEPSAPLLSVQDVSVEIGDARATEQVSFDIRSGETLAVVGESGSGKSLMSLAILGLLPEIARVADGRLLFSDRDGSRYDLTRLGVEKMENVRGAQISMIFQEPMTSLNPVYTIGEQIVEIVEKHTSMRGSKAWAHAVEMLRQVGITDPEARARDYPHQLSGGMRQRAMIAMALSCSPSLLIADEPTTALDVTVQAEILELLGKLKRGNDGQGMSMLFISHNLGVVADIADRVVVMYAGRIVEEAPARTIFANARHPYTRGLLAGMPEGANAIHRSGTKRPRLQAIPGSPPGLKERPTGCKFQQRCPLANPDCALAEPKLLTVGDDSNHQVRCIRVDAA